LIDAVRSFKVGPAWDGSSRMGPVIEPPGEKLLRGLTELEPDQNWVIRPRQLDDDGVLWSPGVRAGVRPGSEYHLTEYFGPILGVMRAETLEEAVDWANQVDYGLTSGLHSLDRAEIEYWIEHIHAGNIYVNRVITGAIVRRQPFGGWKKSAVGAGAKAGGPNYLVGLVDWSPAEFSSQPTAEPSAPNLLVSDFLNSIGQSDPFLEQAAASDAHELATRFANSDITGLGSERNVLRYRPTLTPVSVRLAPGGQVRELIRVVAAGLASSSGFRVSVADELPRDLWTALVVTGVDVRKESDEQFASGLNQGNSTRVRLIGDNAANLQQGLGGRPDIAIWDQPVTLSGRLELLPFLLEQALSVTAHRYGSPDPMTEGLA
jgi:RHH-type proline utilization regulon transcriptional repressor/proline dehydrogenase/delta 1-pyrroline-5-carboxylate dehydrogenase